VVGCGLSVEGARATSPSTTTRGKTPVSRNTYSAYARGIDMVNVAYHYLELVPKGRDEDEQKLFWVRRHDEY
jgi:predicted dithiol-disulfide oxidoreductase (DUF899 family)